MTANAPAARGVVLNLRVVPRAAHTEMRRRSDGTFRVRLQAPPVDGKANAALIRFLADRFGLARKDVRLLSGETSRDKRVLLANTTKEAVQARLPA